MSYAMQPNENFLNEWASSTGYSHLNDDQKIQEILQEQQKLQQLYNELIVYIQEHQNMPSDEMFKYHAQLKQLSEYYQANQEKLKLLGYSSVQVNKDVVIKKWATRAVSVRTIFMGCGVLFFLLIIGLIVLFYTILQNPTSGWGLGMLGIAPAVAKNLLMGLTGIAMLIVVLVGIVILLMNVYKLFTVKNKPKIWYGAGTFLGVMVLGIGLAAGTSVLGQVGKIEVESLANPGETVLAYVEIPSKADPKAKTQITANSILVAPVNVPFKLLTANYQRYAEIELWSQTVTNLQLDCGNGQILDYNQQSTEFNGACFYSKKGNYPINLIIHYNSNQTNQNERKSFSLQKDIVVRSELSLKTTTDKKLELIDNEYVLWPLPAELSFNADQVFRDLGLRNYRINWDVDGDGTVDKTDETSISYTYEKAEVYYPTFVLPELNQHLLFSFPLRVEKSLTPVCKISFTQKKVNDYNIQVDFLDGGERFIADYSYVITDAATKEQMDAFPGKDMGMNFNYAFKGQGLYLVKMNFVTTEGKKGECSSELRLSDKATFAVNYDIFLQSPRSSSFKKVDKSQIEKKLISLSEIPTKIKLKINEIQPRTYNAVVQVSLDGRPIVETLTDEYLFDVKDAKEHIIMLQVEDKVRGLSYTEELKVNIGLDDVIGDLKVVGEKSGYSPLVVTLDASASKLNDPNDEIAYFSWDFGDGEVQSNVSHALVKHTYYYNTKKNIGIFKPSVSITTKKGRSTQVVLDDSIVVNKQLVKLDIIPTSHPTQEARVWDQVSFSLNFNGLPNKVYWSFDDGNDELSCEGRACIEMVKSFEKAGSYTIKVRMEFEDQQQVEQTLLFKVRE